jgi:hypothetical protein
MQASSLGLILHLLGGAAILLVGRRLFWLFVAVVGFLASFEYVPLLLPGRPEWVVLLVSVSAGVLGAVLAIGLQYVAAAIVGFLAGSYGSLPLVLLLGGQGESWIPLVGGLVGAVLMLLLFDWTLIVLSALAGARAVLVPFALQGGLGVLVWLAVAAVGIAVQASVLAPVPAPGRRPDSTS